MQAGVFQLPILLDTALTKQYADANVTVPAVDHLTLKISHLGNALDWIIEH
jgi:hypothetical protein